MPNRQLVLQTRHCLKDFSTMMCCTEVSWDLGIVFKRSHLVLHHSAKRMSKQ